MSSRIAATWKNKELRRKILFTLGIIILYRIGAQIPSPGVNYTAVKAALDNMQSVSYTHLTLPTILLV